MTTHSNYMTVNSTCYEIHDAKDCRPTLKEEIRAIIYPALGTLGAIYQLYLLLFS